MATDLLRSSDQEWYRCQLSVIPLKHVESALGFIFCTIQAIISKILKRGRISSPTLPPPLLHERPKNPHIASWIAYFYITRYIVCYMHHSVVKAPK